MPRGFFKRKSLIDRLTAGSKLIKNGCRIWLKAKSPEGYGKIKHENKVKLAHRMVYELEKGPIPNGLYVCHTCDKPGCINISHLFLGTPSENTLDSVRKNRHHETKKKKCDKGHYYSRYGEKIKNKYKKCKVCQNLKRGL